MKTRSNQDGPGKISCQFVAKQIEGKCRERANRREFVQSSLQRNELNRLAEGLSLKKRGEHLRIGNRFPGPGKQETAEGDVVSRDASLVGDGVSSRQFLTRAHFFRQPTGKPDARPAEQRARHCRDDRQTHERGAETEDGNLRTERSGERRTTDP